MEQQQIKKGDNTENGIWIEHRVIEDIADFDNADNAINIWDILEMQPEKFSKSEPIDMNDGKVCDDKDEDVLEEVIPTTKMSH